MERSNIKAHLPRLMRVFLLSPQEMGEVEEMDLLPEAHVYGNNHSWFSHLLKVLHLHISHF